MKNLKSIFESDNNVLINSMLKTFADLSDGIFGDYSIRRYTLGHADVTESINKVFKLMKFKHTPTKGYFEKSLILKALNATNKVLSEDVDLSKQTKDLIISTNNIIKSFGKELDINMETISDKYKNNDSMKNILTREQLLNESTAPKTDKEQVIELYNSGKSQTEISDITGIDFDKVVKYTNHLGHNVGKSIIDDKDDRIGDDPQSKQYYDRVIYPKKKLTDKTDFLGELGSSVRSWSGENFKDVHIQSIIDALIEAGISDSDLEIGKSGSPDIESKKINEKVKS